MGLNFQSKKKSLRVGGPTWFKAVCSSANCNLISNSINGTASEIQNGPRKCPGHPSPPELGTAPCRSECGIRPPTPWSLMVFREREKHLLKSWVSENPLGWLGYRKGGLGKRLPWVSGSPSAHTAQTRGTTHTGPGSPVPCPGWTVLSKLPNLFEPLGLPFVRKGVARVSETPHSQGRTPSGGSRTCLPRVLHTVHTRRTRRPGHESGRQRLSQ